MMRSPVGGCASDRVLRARERGVGVGELPILLVAGEPEQQEAGQQCPDGPLGAGARHRHAQQLGQTLFLQESGAFRTTRCTAPSQDAATSAASVRKRMRCRRGWLAPGPAPGVRPRPRRRFGRDGNTAAAACTLTGPLPGPDATNTAADPPKPCPATPSFCGATLMSPDPNRTLHSTSNVAEVVRQVQHRRTSPRWVSGAAATMPQLARCSSSVPA